MKQLSGWALLFYLSARIATGGQQTESGKDKDSAVHIHFNATTNEAGDKCEFTDDSSGPVRSLRLVKEKSSVRGHDVGNGDWVVQLKNEVTVFLYKTGDIAVLNEQGEMTRFKKGRIKKHISGLGVSAETLSAFLLLPVIPSSYALSACLVVRALQK